MTVGIQVTNLQQVIAGLGVAGQKIELAAQFGLNMVGASVWRQAQINANTGHHPIGQGHIPGTGPGPNTMTTNLRDQIYGESRRSGFGDYEYVVASPVVYARAVELGSPLWKSGVRYPYMRPAADKVRPRAHAIFTEAFVAHLRR